MKYRYATPCLCLLAVLATGCASGLNSRSPTRATIYATTAEIPILFADSTFVGEVDGIPTERGKGYVLVDPGRRRLTVFNISCPLPIMVIFCLRSASRWHVQAELLPGAAYQIEWNGLVEISPDGTRRIDGQRR